MHCKAYRRFPKVLHTVPSKMIHNIEITESLTVCITLLIFQREIQNASFDTNGVEIGHLIKSNQFSNFPIRTHDSCRPFKKHLKFADILLYWPKLVFHSGRCLLLLFLEQRYNKNDFIQSKIIPILKLPRFSHHRKWGEKARQLQSWNFWLNVVVLKLS